MKKSISLITILCILLTLSFGCSAQQSAPQPAPGQDVQPAEKAEFVMKVCCATTNDAQARVLETIKEYIEKETNGRIEVQTYPNSQMGSSAQMHQLLQSGAIQGIYEPSMFMSGFVEALTICDLPYLFDFNKVSLQDLVGILNGPVGDPIRDYAEGKGLIVGTINPVATRNVLTKFDIKSIADLKNKKIRTGSKALQDQWAALGAVGVPLAVPELYTALQQGTVEGVESNLTFFYNGKYTEVAKYYLDEPLGLMTSVCLWNKAFVEGLPDDLEEIVRGASLGVQEAYLTDFWADNDKTITLAKDMGVEFLSVSVEMHEEMMSLTKSVHEKYLKENPDVKPVYDAIMEAMAKENIK